MMKRNHVLSLVLSMSMIVWTAGAFAADEWGEFVVAKDKPIKIGFGATLTGAYAKLGLDIQKGAEMAIEEANKFGGHDWEMVAGDSGCEGAPAVALAEKYCADKEIVAVVGMMCSGASLPASEALNRCKKVMISPSSTHADLTKKGFQNVFRICPNDAAQGSVAAKFIAKKLKGKKLAVLHDKSAYGQGIADVVKGASPELGVEVVAYEGITRGDKDFTAVLTKIKPLEPDVIYFGGMDAEGALLARQIKDVGLKGIFMGDEGLHDPETYIKVAGRAAEGSYITSPKVSKVKSVTEFKEKYEKKHGPLGVYSAQGYDAAKAILMGIRKVGQQKDDGTLVIGKKALADALKTIEFYGASGKVAFDEYGDNKGTKWKISVVEGGKFVPAKRKKKGEKEEGED